MFLQGNKKISVLERIFTYRLHLIIISSSLSLSPLPFIFPHYQIFSTHMENLIKYLVFIYLIYLLFHLKLKSWPRNIHENRIPQNFIYLLLFFHTLYLTIVTWLGYHSLHLGTFDFTGISTVSSSYKTTGQFLYSPFYTAANGSGIFISHHFSPLLLIFSPFYMPFNTHLVYGFLLVLVYTVFLWILYQYTRDIFKNETGFWIFLALFFYPLLSYQAISFHFEMLVLPLAILLFWGLHKNNKVMIGFSFILLLLLKEDISFYLFFFGFYLVLNPEKRKIGILISGVSLGWFILTTRFLLPYLSGENESRFLSYWNLGSSMSEVIKNIISNPGLIISSITTKSQVFSRLFLALALMPLFNPLFTLVVLTPVLMIHLLSNHPFFGTFTSYYTYTILPFLIYATVSGFSNLEKIILVFLSNINRLKIPKIISQKFGKTHDRYPLLVSEFANNSKTILAVILFLFSISAASNDKNLPYYFYNSALPGKNLDIILEKIPQHKNVHGDSFLLSHLSLDKNGYFLSDNRFTYEYLIFQSGRIPSQFDSIATSNYIHEFCKIYGKIVSVQGDFVLYFLDKKEAELLKTNLNSMK